MYRMRRFWAVLASAALILTAGGCAKEMKRPTDAQRDAYGFRIAENEAKTYTNKDKGEGSETLNAPFLVETDYRNDDVPIAVANVLNYGAKGDGTTDDTAAFNEAMLQVSCLLYTSRCV